MFGIVGCYFVFHDVEAAAGFARGRRISLEDLRNATRMDISAFSRIPDARKRHVYGNASLCPDCVCATVVVLRQRL